VGSAVAALRSWPRLQGYRGRPPGNVEALTETLARLSAFACERAERILEIEINPLMVTPRGVFAADALITVRTPEHRPDGEAED